MLKVIFPFPVYFNFFHFFYSTYYMSVTTLNFFLSSCNYYKHPFYTSSQLNFIHIMPATHIYIIMETCTKLINHFRYIIGFFFVLSFHINPLCSAFPTRIPLPLVLMLLCWLCCNSLCEILFMLSHGRVLCLYISI